MAVAHDAMHLVEAVDDVAALPDFSEPLALLAQTTLSHREWADVLDSTAARYPDIWRPGHSDLCFATTNRPSALTAIAGRCDAFVVIGSANSSNTRALEKLALESPCGRVVRINTPDELPADLEGTVGVTAGASAPEELVDAIIARLAPDDGLEEVRITTEEEYFPPPPELRDLLAAIDVACTFALGGPVEARPSLNDRTIAASDVLAALAP
jgi:4-hydroxy-3-methylbut-2-enyl diphosphate reductase